MKNINTLLLYIFLILLIFCIMYMFIYNDKEIIFDSIDLNIPDNDKNNEYKLYVKNTLKAKLKEKFAITNEESTEYINKLRELQINIRNNQSMREELNNFLIDVANQNKTEILDNITNIYLKYYVEYIDKKNATVYNQFIKFNKSNKDKTQ